MESLAIDILSPQKRLFSGMVREITLPGAIGPFTILPKHAPIISSLAEGKISFVLSESSDESDVGYEELELLSRDEKGRYSIEIKGGFIEMSEDRVTVCVI